MDKERFNALLADIDQITDADVKSLNQLRKQYPYFQNQYVLIAKALKERNHPKADAFVKKAAIYVSDRGLLKGIVTGTHTFEKVEEEPPTPPPAKTEPPPKAEPKATQATTTQTQEPAQKEEAADKAPDKPLLTKAKAKHPVKELTTEKNTETLQEEQKVAGKTETQSAPRTPTPNKATPAESTDNQELISELEKDLKEIREKKRLLAKMLEQSESKTTTVRKPSKSANKKPGRKNQSELIEKFIKNEPQMDKNRASDDGNNSQEDLASKNIRESEDFHTETLAELMVKQKKYKKAIHIYEKLSLKFPEKLAYFATQIERIKKEYHV